MCVCACGFPCVNHAEHRLLETLSKSPQCDNWLPRVAVSLLIIIVISCSEEREREKKKKGVRSMTLVGRLLVPLKKLISSLPELWRSFPAMTQTVQIQCDQPSGPPCAGFFVTMLMLMSKQKSTCVTTVVSTEYILGLKHKAASWGQESFTTESTNWFAMLTPEVVLCMCWRPTESSSPSLVRMLSQSPVYREPKADCWPLHRGNVETAGHLSPGPADVQVTRRRCLEINVPNSKYNEIASTHRLH